MTKGREERKGAREPRSVVRGPYRGICKGTTRKKKTTMGNEKRKKETGPIGILNSPFFFPPPL